MTDSHSIRHFCREKGAAAVRPGRTIRLLQRMARNLMEERLNNLESKLCLAEDLLDTLNRTVFRQQEQIDQLQAQIRLLYEQIRNAPGDAGGQRDLREEIPPHY